MILKSLTYGNDRICKAIIEGDAGHEYVTSMDADSDTTWCTCPFYIFRKITCKHVLHLLDNIEYEKMKPTKRFKNFPSGCLTIDTLMGNGFPQGSTVAVFAESGIGKTILSAQLALSCIKNLNKDVIIIETEGNREQDYLELLNRFKDRWGLTDKDIESRVHFISVITGFSDTAKSMGEVLKLVGYNIEIEKSKKGDKHTITFKDIKPKFKDDILKSSGLLIIDSLTEPLKTTIGSKSQNLPARAELISRFFYKLISIARDYNICVVLNHHASINPFQLFGRDFGKPYGGDEVLYNSKYILAIIDSDMAARAKYGDTARRIFMLKHPYQSITKQLQAVNLKKDYGFTDEE